MLLGTLVSDVGRCLLRSFAPLAESHVLQVTCNHIYSVGHLRTKMGNMREAKRMRFNFHCVILIKASCL